MKNYNFFILFGKMAEEAIDLIEDLEQALIDDIRLILIESMDTGVVKLDDINQFIEKAVAFVGESMGLISEEHSREEKLSEFFGVNISDLKKNSSILEAERQEFIRKIAQFSNIERAIISLILMVEKEETKEVIERLVNIKDNIHLVRASSGRCEKMFDFIDKLEYLSLYDRKMLFIEFFGEKHFDENIEEIRSKSIISEEEKKKLLKELNEFSIGEVARICLACTYEESEEVIQRLVKKIVAELPPEIQAKIKGEL